MPFNFQIKKGDQVLATLRNCGSIGTPWLSGEFLPTETFTEIESLVRESTETEDMDVVEANWGKIHDMGIVLEDMDTGIAYEYFIIHIMDEGQVDLRF